MTSTEPRTEQEILDRESMDDVDAIAAFNPDPVEVLHAVQDQADALFTWDYSKGARPRLDKLYEKAKVSQWNAQTDLDWSIEVDLEALMANSVRDPMEVQYFEENPDSPLRNFSEKEWSQLGIESFNWSLSQFMHGEQGALLCTAKIVESVPWIDAKYYAATQVVDEARHVEVFAQYLDTKLGGIGYPVNHHLGLLLDDIINDSRWDITYLGMQIMVEGLALAAFGFMHQTTQEPLLKKLLRYVMSDEARHVAFGVLSLKEVYQDMTQAELLERQEFAFEAAVRMRDRFLQQEVWERMGADVKKVIPLAYQDPLRQEFQQLLFTKIVPNCKKLGLLDAGDGWLRKKFGEIGVIQYEDWVDIEDEVDSFAITRELEAEAALAES